MERLSSPYEQLNSELRIEDRPARENFVVTDSYGRRGIVKDDPNSYLLPNPRPVRTKRTKYYINDD